MATSITLTDAAIAGLREQILANAMVLFPSIVERRKTKTQVNKFGATFDSYVPPSEVFSITVSKDVHVEGHKKGGRYYLSVLGYTFEGLEKLVARSDPKDTVPEALRSLLDATADAMAGTDGVLHFHRRGMHADNTGAAVDVEMVGSCDDEFVE